jgi:hypothetical protein
MDCLRRPFCIFFTDKMPQKPAMPHLKRTYCNGDNSHCARYLLCSAGKPIPDDLYPDQEERAKQILAASAR